ncbi:hypothetical protein APICC_08492 [Apis cerana cerana]|uniref:Uncharacterized protein n=1 Tax=Apis cerana cerana TaxID=94128 RepID=A0A2A3ETC5_APICC|nr:hypothetical protein APICC_08492 [Apis cerana cerana]
MYYYAGCPGSYIFEVFQTVEKRRRCFRISECLTFWPIRRSHDVGSSSWNIDGMVVGDVRQCSAAAVALGAAFHRIPTEFPDIVAQKNCLNNWAFGSIINRAQCIARILCTGKCLSFSSSVVDVDGPHVEHCSTDRGMNLFLVLALIELASGDPGGLLRVPKVYNAVITSNQNLSPSRAYPVIQPVIHRTAIGYVPPVYYTQVAPHLAGPEVVHLSQRVSKQPNDVQTAPSSSIERSKSTDKTESTNPTNEEEEEEEGNKGVSGSKGKSGDQEPLSFYPNYQSLYYDPYFYTYSGFNPHLVPGTYYVDYQPYGTLEPIPATTPRNGLTEHLLPAYHEEKKLPGKDEKEKIPDVPPPPLPTAVPKSS